MIWSNIENLQSSQELKTNTTTTVEQILEQQEQLTIDKQAQ